MCDYSLHAVATRPAEVAETLVSTNFFTGTYGFARRQMARVVSRKRASLRRYFMISTGFL